jgi:hypothetical protein
VAVKEPEKHTDPTDDAAALSDIAGIAAELASAGKDAEKASALVDDIMERIASLDDEAQGRLMGRPAMQKLLRKALETETPPKKTDPPGTIYFKTSPGGDKAAWSKKPYTWADLKDMPTQTWIPHATMLLGFQGLFVTIKARQRTTLPEVFYGVYEDSLNNIELAEQHAAYFFKKGGVPKDPSILTPDGARSRALANHRGDVNIYEPGKGVIADWSPDLMKEGA